MFKKISIAVGVLGFLAATGVAFAQVASTTPPTMSTTSSQPAMQMLLNVGTGGKVLLRGTVDSVSASSITVKSWGGDWTINVPTSAEVLPQGAALSSFQQGDFVGVQGTINQSGNWTVDATVVRDWTARQAMNQQIQQNVQAVRQMMSGAPRTIQGTVSGLSGQSFTLTDAKGAVFSVSLATGAKITQKNWLTLDFTQVQNGDTVRVWGPVSSSSVSASIFRDVSIPRQ